MCDKAASAVWSPPHLGLGFACGLTFTTVHVKRALGDINMRDTDCQQPKCYLGLASFCCRLEVRSFHLNAFIERIYNTVAAIAKACVQ